MKKEIMKIENLKEVKELKEFYSQQNVDDLVLSIDVDGLKNPIIINNDHQIIDGYRRVQAFLQLGKTDIEVYVDDVQPTLYERVVRNMTRKKTSMDEINDMKTIFLRYPSRQGQRKLGYKYSRFDEISKSLNNRWNDESVIKKLEYVLNNDIGDHLLSKSIVENRNSIEPCYDYLTKYSKIDKDNNYGYSEKLMKGELTVSQTNKFIEERERLDKKFEPTFSIPGRCNYYLQDCREVEKLTNYYNQVDTLITSIPYYQLENYEINGEQQLGHEKTKEEYGMNIVGIINKQIPLLKKSCNVFINVGETYQDGLGLGIPYLIQNYITQHTELKYRGTIYWSKKNPKPQSETVKRDGDSIEHVLWFVLDPKVSKFTQLTYLTNDGWNGEISNGPKDVSKDGKRSKKSKTLKKPYKKFLNHLREQDLEDIVRTSVGGNHDLLKISSEGHPCPFNPLLVLSLILKSTERDDDSLIYDCFSGSTVVGQVSTLLNKRFLGVELNKKYFDIGCEVLTQSNKMFDSDSLKIINDFVYQKSDSERLRIAA